MPAAVQAAAPASVHSCVLSTNLSLMTVSFMFDAFTHFGVRSEAGCSLPLVPDGGLVVPFSNAEGGVWPARRMVATATASWAES